MTFRYVFACRTEDMTDGRDFFQTNDAKGRNNYGKFVRREGGESNKTVRVAAAVGEGNSDLFDGLKWSHET